MIRNGASRVVLVGLCGIRIAKSIPWNGSRAMCVVCPIGAAT